ncbi:MAG: signal peptidase II [Nitrospiraceae bacterium]|nr:signal peptidase II [Nitrospiraceae bacterium]
MNGTLRYVLLGALSFVIIVLDQWTKLHVMDTMRLHESIPVVPNLFSITYIRNPGAAFGFLSSSSSSFRFIFFGITSVFALGLLGTILVRMPADEWMGQLSVAGILGGAIGNLLDRLRYGEVIDFLDFYVNGYHWPAFNIADSAITVGVAFLILHFAFEKQKDPEPAPSEDRPA